MNHKEKLLEIYELSSTISDIDNIESDIKKHIDTVAEKSFTQKGVYTVLVTLLTHKVIFPEQDVRIHQSGMENGFSGRSIDTKYITPTLKQLGLPSMNESGWLTRSLEQNFPYTLDYNGKISDKKVKESFLQILHYIQSFPERSQDVLRLLLNKIREVKESSVVEIKPLENPEYLTIESIIWALDEHFSTSYKTHGGSKLPVIAFYSIYLSLVNELQRYTGKTLGTLGSHTASDRTSKSAGDIEIFEDGKHFEVLEIKLDKIIDSNIVRVAIEKIHKFNPKRYYILSNVGVQQSDVETIKSLVQETKSKHGCQIIINGLIPTLKYYLRLISNLEDFVTNYSTSIEQDDELQKVHKVMWNSLMDKYLK